MKFKNNEERLQHPQASIIPETICLNSSSFWNSDNSRSYYDIAEVEFSDKIISLIKTIQDTPDLLLEYLIENQNVLKASNKKVGLIIALTYGELDYPVLQQIQTLFDLSDETLFKISAEVGNVELMKLLNNKHQGKEWAQKIISFNYYKIFSDAARYGHLKLVHYLAEQVPALLQLMITNNDHLIFRLAASYGHLEIIKFLKEQMPDELQDMIAANDYAAFYAACIRGHLLIVKYLAEQAPDRLEEMVAVEDYFALDLAASWHHAEVVNFLLFTTAGFAYAESHEQQFDEYTTWFIDDCLDDLRHKKADYGDTALPITPKEAKFLFYLARALIRRDEPQEDLRLILEIPEVKALAHQAVTPGYPNELLRLAARLGNQEAADYLLTIPAVQQEAAANNFYLDEYQGINLRAMAQDKESSMIALSKEESERLEVLKNQYLTKDLRSSDQILEELRTLLIKRYEENPPRITINDSNTGTSSLILPWRWKDFSALSLSLSENEKQMALETYYKNKNHSAWRFLAKPNPWMHPDALYIKHSGLEQWSYFDDYLELIAVLFLAAKDEDISGVDGFDVESRITQFIDELALIGRSHNWDNKNAKQQEYDDLKADRPSCYSGIKRRLFQSVQGHPLLQQLTLDILQQELREFVWRHFQKAITEDNKELFSSIWHKSIDIDMLTEKEEEILSKSNISKDDQISWVKKLQNKYGDQINHFKVGLLQRFNLSEHESHFIHFAYLNLDQLLNKPDLQEENSITLVNSMTQSLAQANRFGLFCQGREQQNNNNNVLNVCNSNR